jgi:Na+-transporting NADH:ubiquinone oxidoreductase subunit B
MLALAVAFAVILEKKYLEVQDTTYERGSYCRAFLFFAYPSECRETRFWIYELTDKAAVDGFSGATPLAQLAQEQHRI